MRSYQRGRRDSRVRVGKWPNAYCQTGDTQFIVARPPKRRVATRAAQRLAQYAQFTGSGAGRRGDGRGTPLDSNQHPQPAATHYAVQQPTAGYGQPLSHLAPQRASGPTGATAAAALLQLELELELECGMSTNESATRPCRHFQPRPTPLVPAYLHRVIEWPQPQPQLRTGRNTLRLRFRTRTEAQKWQTAN